METKLESLKSQEIEIQDQLIEFLQITSNNNDGHTYIRGKIFQLQAYNPSEYVDNSDQEVLRVSLKKSVTWGYLNHLRNYNKPITNYCEYLCDWIPRNEFKHLEQLLTVHLENNIKQNDLLHSISKPTGLAPSKKQKNVERIF